jgi:hypothetical protein
MKRGGGGVAGMSVYTAALGCPACRDSASGHCAAHPPATQLERSEAALPSGQRRYYDASRPERVMAEPAAGPLAGDVELTGGQMEAQPGDFELHIAEGEPPARKHGPLADSEPPKAQVWATRASRPCVHRERASKGWRRHLRRTKALARTGRSGT